ncbi:MAG: hypothetical protein DRG50_07515 [Deltaproteobacteria bacterium]|nr:MAG: hypothetical protein DRG50_07515 [Deltaproteobacteria bacterium]
MKKGWIILALTILLGLSGGKILAQPAEPFPPAEDRPINRERAQELKKRVELIWMWRLTEELELTEEEGAKLFPLLRKYEEKKRKLRDERRKLFWKLKRMVEKSEATEEALKETIKALEENDKELQKVRIDGFNEIKKILPVKKQAKYIIFQEHFRREIHGLIERAKRKKMGPKRP